MYVCMYRSVSLPQSSVPSTNPLQSRFLFSTWHHFLLFDLLQITPSGSVNIGNGIFGGGMCKLMVSIWVSSALRKPSRAVACCRTARTLHPRLLTLAYGLGAL
uniref:Uncharacterized protein n=1 Tax=Arundo donax TaxID=35708 RepID=A0A0A9D3K4_ARUDO